MAEQKQSPQNQTFFVECSCVEVSEPFEVPQLVDKWILSFLRKSSWCVWDR